jgi:predicted transcriptional regulator
MFIELDRMGAPMPRVGFSGNNGAGPKPKQYRDLWLPKVLGKDRRLKILDALRESRGGLRFLEIQYGVTEAGDTSLALAELAHHELIECQKGIYRITEKGKEVLRGYEIIIAVVPGVEKADRWESHKGRQGGKKQ